MIKIKTFICFIISISTLSSVAQGNYGGGVDDQDLHFGFGFQYISSEYKIQKYEDWQTPYSDGTATVYPGLKSIRSIQNPGFGIGFVADVYVTPNVNLRFTPVFVFADRVVDYEFTDGISYDRQGGAKSPEGFTRRTVNSTMFDFPLGIKLKSDRRNNFRAYLLAGVKYGIDIGAKKNAADAGDIPIKKQLKNTKNVLSYDVGIGFDLYFEFFKLSPEIKLSNSIKSILKREDHPYTSPLEKLYLRNFVFSLYFE